MTNTLPIREIIPNLRHALSACNNVVLQAPPGAGKTTVVPLELLDAPWLGDKKILMLEPRRLAARAAARRMAQTLNEKVGDTVGYRVKLDSKVSKQTKIEVVTEGILIRRIQNDPELSEIGLIIFDEFHERSIDADLGLAFALDIQAGLRDDLKVLVMSATLDGETVASLMNDAPIVTSEGRSYPVEYRYVTPSKTTRIEDETVRTITRALNDEEGSILVFLPGAGEIKKVESSLSEISLDPSIIVCPLYGMMPFEAQDQAIKKAPDGTRKVVLATAIAETSLTIEGVRIVVDSGLQRFAQYDPRSGMSGLETTMVSRASADQRAGRAGRLERGICYRLWSEAKHRALIAYNEPEIKRADLVPLSLDLATWGVSDVQELKWLDPPDRASIDAARDLLMFLGALNKQLKITEHGKEMSDVPMHPRLAHMVLSARSQGLGWTAVLIAALLEERDILLLKKDEFTADMALRLQALDSIIRGDMSAAKKLGTKISAAKKIIKQAHIWARQFDIAQNTIKVDRAGYCLAIAFPDRIGARRTGHESNYILASGKGGSLKNEDPLSGEKYVAVGHLDKGNRDARIFLAAALQQSDIEELIDDRITDQTIVEFDARRKKVRAEKVRLFMKLPLETGPIKDVDAELIQEAMLAGIGKMGIDILPWTKKAKMLRKRISLISEDEMPDMSDQSLLDHLEEWLGPFLRGISSISSLSRLDLEAILKSMMSYEQGQLLERLVPTHIKVPSGSNIRIDYMSDEPVLAVKLQEMFGATRTPTILGGKLPVTIHLLSPAQRPLQITKDLAGFWENSYPEIKKEMKGRYPKHPWPDDPLEALPTRRAKSKGR